MLILLWIEVVLMLFQEIKRAPIFMQRIGLEWFYRFLKNLEDFGKDIYLVILIC